MSKFTPNQEQEFVGFRVTGEYTQKDGKVVSNPREFPYPKKKPEFVGLSVRCKKVLGYNKKMLVEASFYGDAFHDAKSLDLKSGDLISFIGYYEVDKGHSRDFHKVSVNDEMQVKRFKGRKAKPSEI